MNAIINVRQQGFVAIASVVIVVVLALLGALMLSTVTTQNIATSQSQREIQAWFSAQSGIDWGVQQVIVSATPCATINGSSFLPAGVASGYTVTVNCASSTVIEAGGPPYDIFKLQANATAGNDTDFTYVSRTVRVTVSERP